jgi:hypothetical protein
MNPGPASLPYWMQVFAFVASGLLAVLTIIGIIIQLTKKPTLKFRLTREIFFRLTDSFAEAIFSNGVLVSENRGIFIDDISFKLNKVNNPKKSFVLRCAFFGEKVRGLFPISDFNWFSTSPLTYVPLVIPQRVSYLLVQQAYEESMKKAFIDFRTKILEAHRIFRDTPPPLEQEQKDLKSKELFEKVMFIVNDYMGKIMELVQIEGGDYELEAEIFYWIKKFIFFKKQQSSISKIAFKIDAKVKDTLRADLMLMLQTISSNLILSENRPIKSPEYFPIEIREL